MLGNMIVGANAVYTAGEVNDFLAKLAESQVR